MATPEVPAVGPRALPYPRRTREIVTPEGVVLRVELADRVARAGAVLIDLLIMLGLIAGLVLALTLTVFELSASGGVSLGLIGFFVVRNFYFAFFEIRWHGRTPGKRAIGLRVVDREGGQLTTDAVFARNLMREVELFLPATIVLTPAGDGLSGAAHLLTWIWAGIFVCLPYFNRDRLRAGDVIAGTWVIAAQRTLLLEDLLSGTGEDGPDTDRLDFAFTAPQLDVYGVLELHTLEEVLRRTDKAAAEVRAEVAARIARKIGYPADAAGTDPKAFLDAYYSALRGRLEARMLIGETKRSQHD